MYTFSVNIPDAVLFDTHMSEKTSASCVRKATALFYYTKMNVSLGYCAEIAEMSNRLHSILIREQCFYL